MCLAVPIKVKKTTKEKTITESGEEVDVSLISEKIKRGDYLLVHDDLAVNKLKKKEAKKILEVVKTCDHDHSHTPKHSH